MQKLRKTLIKSIFYLCIRNLLIILVERKRFLETNTTD